MEIKDLNYELELKKESDVKSEKIVTSDNKNQQHEKNDVLNKRGINSKTFQTKKGFFETKYYNAPVHFYDTELGTYVEAGRELEQMGDGTAFVNNKNDFEAVFYKNEDSNALFSISRDIYQVAAYVKNTFGKKTVRPVPEWSAEDRKLYYVGEATDTEYSCEVIPQGIKFNVIAKNVNQKNRFSFDFMCENLRYHWDSSKKVLQFISEDTDEIIFEIPTPFMKDNSGAYSESMDFEVVSKSKNECELTLIPDIGWLTSKAREVPVSVEWSIINREHLCCGINFENISADGIVQIGSMASRFEMRLPERRTDMITKNVRLMLYCTSVPVVEDKKFVLALSRISAFDETETLIGVNTMSVDKEEYSFDVTSEYSAEEGTTYALQLYEEQDEALIVTAEPAVALMNVSETSTAAVFSVSESDGTSEEDSFAGETGNIGSVGTYEVDLATGKLNIEVKDFAWEGKRMPVAITHYLKGLTAVTDWSSGLYGGTKIGNGWRLNIMQNIVNTGVQLINNKYRDTYTYTDETGGGIKFAQCECESGSSSCTIYEDVDGTGYTFDASTGIMNKGSEKYYFTSKRLSRIVDEYGNTMHINYSSGKITSVVDGVGRRFEFNYIGNELVSISLPNNTSINYQYCNGCLCCIGYPNGQNVSFKYGENSMQPTEITVSGNGISNHSTCFAYSSGGITQITTKVDGNVSKRYTEFKYISKGKLVEIIDIDEDEGDVNFKKMKQHRLCYLEQPQYNYSYFESNAPDENDGNGDDNKIDVSGGSVILPYTEPGMNIGNMRCQNLLNNHNFIRNNSSISMSYWGNNLNEEYRSILYDPNEGMCGAIAAYLVSLVQSDRQRGMWQWKSLTPNADYVFSCYLKLDNKNSNSSHGVYLMVHDADGRLQAKSPMITTKGDFNRVVLPFHVAKDNPNQEESTSGCMKQRNNIKVGIYIDGNVKAKVIAPQLERGTMLSPYNYVGYSDCKGFVYATSEGRENELTSISVPSKKDERETFTLSCEIKGSITGNTQLVARINYYGDTSPDDFSLPIYSGNNEWKFVMLQFAKEKYASIENIQIFMRNEDGTTNIEYQKLQVVRNKLETGLTEEDFLNASSDTADILEDVEERTSANEEDVETIVFKELLDSYGNALTGTNFKNGELGAIYTEYRYADSDSEDAIGDAGNNKTEKIDARGHSTKYEYDPVTSKPTAVIDRLDNRTEYIYDRAGRTKCVSTKSVIKNESGEITGYNQEGTASYEYNAYDDLTKITRGDGQAYTMGYDAYRNLTCVNVGLQNLVTYEYKSGGNRLKSMEYANGAKQTLTYDRFGNVIGEKWTNGNTKEAEYKYSYDASQNLVKILDILNKKMYNINRVGDNVTSIEEYNVGYINTTTYTVSIPTLVGTMYYSFDGDGKQFRKKYVAAAGSEQKYVFEYRDEQNVAVQLPTGVVSHRKSDHLGRKVFDELQLRKGLINRKFTYHDGVISQAHLDSDKQVSMPETTLVKKIEFADGRTIEYEYDKEERITLVKDSVDGNTAYEYDSLGQLTQEIRNVEIDENGDITGGTPIEFTYDDYGNILTKNGKVYGYDNSNDNPWKDRLLSYDGQSIIYDANGNPTNYLGTTATWEKGRQLKTFGTNTYTYNKDGIRIKKQTSDTIHEYILDGTNVIKETVTDTANCPKYINEYLYDLDGTVCGLKYDGVAYYFYKNLQGDVIAITDETGAIVASYTYDAWGKCTIVSDTSGVNISEINPFRYRSYYYDAETEFYYLQSRYYDPEVGRFINRDNIRFIAKRKLFNNLFAYCSNNPICNVDANGKFWSIIIGVVVLVAFAATLCGCSDSQDSTKVNDVETADNSEYAMYLKVHKVALGNYHTCLVIVTSSDNTKYISIDKSKSNVWNIYSSQSDSKYFTIGAGGSSKSQLSGNLVSDYNRPRDKDLTIAKEMQKLDDIDKDKIQEIVKYHEYYMSHGNLQYTLFPSGKNDKYNSNSFTCGLLNVAKISYTDPGFKVPGWDKPLLDKYFGA